MNAVLNRLPRKLPVSSWSDIDQDAWAAATQGGDILDETGLANPWRAPTRKKVEHAVGYFLGWAIDEGKSPLASVPDLCTIDTLRTYITWLTPRVAPMTVLGLVVDLGEYCKVVWPDWSRSHLKRAGQALRWKATPTKEKRSRLRSTSELVKLGETLMAQAQQIHDGDPRLPLALYRDGFAIALLALRPLRIRAFGSLQLGKHVQQIGERWKIIIPPGLSKTHRPWEGDVPESLIPALIRYLDEIRPRLLRQRGRWYREPGHALWISMDGSPMRPKALAEAITKRTGDAFGQSISPHYFRDCAATTLALDSPENVRLTTPLLGHSDPRTAEKHYNQARSLDAGRKHLDALNQIRRNLR